MTAPLVSLVIAARNEGDNLIDTVGCALETGAALPFEIVVIDDGSSDGSGYRAAQQFRSQRAVAVHRSDGIGVAGARNLGARQAQGEILVFLDAHCWCPPGWLEALIAPLADAEVGLSGPAFVDLVSDHGGIGCGVVWPKPDLQISWLAPRPDPPYAVPLMPGGCDALRRALFFELGGYDVGMRRWGSEGEELSLRVWSSGLEVRGVPGCVVRHLFRPRHPYPIDSVEVLYNRLRMATVHFPAARLRRVLDASRDQSGGAEARALLTNSDASVRRRARTAANAAHVAGWFERFAIDW